MDEGTSDDDEPTAAEPEPPAEAPPPPEHPTPQSAGQPPGTPGAPGTPGGATTPGGGPTSGSGRPRGRAGSGKVNVWTTWRGWWMVNDRSLYPLRTETVATVTPGTGDEPAPAPRRTERERVNREEILPPLRRLLAPQADVDDLMRRTGLLALGKTAVSEEDVALLLAWLGDAKADADVRDAAALGAGLLRRSDPALRLPADVLDAVRRKLLDVAEDTETPEGVRATAAISLGLLGDQPFGHGVQENGRLVAERLGRVLRRRGARVDLTLAALTALGMQPPPGVVPAMRAALADAVQGRKALDRRWDDTERSHALTALARLEGVAARRAILKAVQGRHVPDEVARAAYIALGRIAGDLDRAERDEAADVLRRSLARTNDPWTLGLGHIATGRLVAAHVAGGSSPSKDLLALWRRLLGQAKSGAVGARGFALIGLALAVREVTEDAPASLRRMRTEAEDVVLEGFVRGRGDAELQGAHAVALGILRSVKALPALTAVAENAKASEDLRRDVCVALGQIGRPTPEVLRALHGALFQTRRPWVQGGAALGLSLLHSPGADRWLLGELGKARTNADVVRVTEPLGYLGRPDVAADLVAYVTSPAHADRARAHMIVSLGLIGDPEPRPSLAELGRDANYPAAPPSLLSALLTR